MGDRQGVNLTHGHINKWRVNGRETKLKEAMEEMRLLKTEKIN